MHFYWRIFEELKWMGEVVVFNDPSLKRSFQNWLQTHSEALALTYGYDCSESDKKGATLH